MEELFKKVAARNTKFIIITGGVCSSIGKGVLISSLGVLLKNAGGSVSIVKWDPYLNVDPGTMSPLVHGEVFVTNDGAETDLDLGHYERMLGVHLTKESSVSSGQIFNEILEGERQGKYLGQDIELVPDVVNVIKTRLLNFAVKNDVDYVLVEIGGTVGDMEADIFLEAIRQLRMDLEPRAMLHGHLSLVPYLSWAKEMKTKPTQHSVMLLKRAGLIPDCLFLRSDRDIEEKSFKKLSVMCGVKQDLIFQVLTHSPLYNLFMDLRAQDAETKLQKWFGVASPASSDLSSWEELVGLINKEKPKVKIGLIAKYVGSNDPYMSVCEAIKSAAWACDRDVELVTIEAEQLEENHPDTKARDKARQELESLDGVVMPGGFDKRGVEGKLYAARWAREQKIPYLGLCLGMQVMLIEFARSVLGMKQATSAEFDPQTEQPIVVLLDEQQDVVQKGGTMRLGAYLCTLQPGTKAQQAYNSDEVSERHRHRYEFNNTYRKMFEEAGVVFSGIHTKLNLVEIAELADHPFMLGTQYHPEFLSTPLKPHPLYKAFFEAIVSK